MTGFSKQNGELNLDSGSFSWSLELKSVNGKGSDIKLRTPMWLGDLTSPFKSLVSKYFSRGSFNVFLEISSDKKEQEFVFNEELLEELISKATTIYEENSIALDKPRASDLLQVKGVVDVREEKISDEDIIKLQNAILETFEQSCEGLVSSRLDEGKYIKEVLVNILEKIEDTTEEIAKIASSVPQKLKENLQKQIEEMLGKGAAYSEERIAQEIVLYVAKADIREEIDRLQAHIQTAYNLLNIKEPVGRKLDFLCQELNREANTTCSKSVDINITNYGLELKTLIEQFREQVQNIE